MLVKINHNLFKILLLCASATVVSACTDHDWKGPDKNSERITFALQTANTDWQARSGRIEGCDIITLLDESTKDTLYLHPNITDMPAPDRAAAPRKGSRGEPIQNPDDFSRIQLNAQGVASFGITAYTSDGDQLYINNAEITQQNGKWEESAPRFWPVEKLDFYGIAPYNALTVDENNLKYDLTNKKVTFDYTVPHSGQGENRDAEVQHDIMMAFTGEQSKQTTSVTTKFWHILAGIQFEVADIAGGKINSITIRNVHGSGTATFDSSKIGGASAEDPTDSWQDNNTIPVTWVAADEPVVEYTQTFNVDVADQYPNQEAEGYNEQGVTSQNPKTTFLLMPQTLTDDAEIVINMTTLKDGEKTLTAKFGNGFTWKAGKIYKYTISTESINWTYVLKVEAIEKDASGERRPNVIGDYIHDKNYPYATAGHDGNGIYEYGVYAADKDSALVGWHENDFSYRVISYRYRTNAPTVTEPVPWTASVGEATNDVNYRVATVPGSEWMPDLTAENGLSGNGSVNGEGAYTTTLKKITLVTSHDKETNCELYKETILGSDKTPENLATKNVERNAYTELCKEQGVNQAVLKTGSVGATKYTDDKGTVHDVKREYFLYSSNCYIVNHPGFYRIPMVIGPSLRGLQNSGGRDPHAYLYHVDGYVDNKKTGTNHKTTTPDLTKFPHNEALLKAFGYDENTFDNSWMHAIYGDEILKEIEVKLLWTDGYKLVTNVKKYDDPNLHYIQFKVPKDYIQQGNAVIGLWHKTAQKFIWTYHIWVTEENLISDAIQSGNYTYAAAPIGHCHPKDEWWTGRKGAITFSQKGFNPSGAEYSYYVHQLTAKYTTTNHNVTYFQHGRKDPFPGMQILGENNILQKHIFYNDGADVTRDPNISTTTDVNIPYKVVVSTAGRQRIWQSINQPYKIMVQGGSPASGRGWQRMDTRNPLTGYRNLWNNFKLQSGAHQTDANKTVYDPSPTGFIVPLYNAAQSLPSNAYGLGKIECLDATGVDKTFFYVEPNKKYYWSSAYSNLSTQKHLAYTNTGALIDESDALPVWPIIDTKVLPVIEPDKTEFGVQIWGRWQASDYNHYYDNEMNK